MKTTNLFEQTQIEKDGINIKSDIVFVLMIIFMVGGSFYSAQTASWAGTYYIQAIVIPLLLLFTVLEKQKSVLIGHLFVLGLITGIVELFADFLLVDVFEILIYNSQDPRIWCSPLNMPISWTCVVISQGYLVIRLVNLFESRMVNKKVAVICAALLGGALAGLTIGAYEALAFKASWWEYVNSPYMVFTYAPLAIILGEFATFALFIYWFRMSTQKSKFSLIKASIGLGLTIAISYSAFHLILLFISK